MLYSPPVRFPFVAVDRLGRLVWVGKWNYGYEIIGVWETGIYILNHIELTDL